jgi:hypothetical protein
MSEQPIDWPPLGLPRGSIRALLTLLIVAVVIVQVVRGQEVELLWAETLMVALAHYFTSRRSLNLPPDVIRRLAAEGHVGTGASPLFLPRYSIRVILILAFAGLAAYLYWQNRLLEPQALSVLGVVCAYFLGVLLRFGRFRLWEDAKALVVLLVLLYAAGAYLADRPDLVPRQLRDIALGLTLFYFGSRA